jgi:hypothetical protein
MSWTRFATLARNVCPKTRARAPRGRHEPVGRSSSEWRLSSDGATLLPRSISPWTLPEFPRWAKPRNVCPRTLPRSSAGAGGQRQERDRDHHDGGRTTVRRLPRTARSLRGGRDLGRGDAGAHAAQGAGLTFQAGCLLSGFGLLSCIADRRGGSGFDRRHLPGVPARNRLELPERRPARARRVPSTRPDARLASKCLRMIE